MDRRFPQYKSGRGIDAGHGFVGHIVEPSGTCCDPRCQRSVYEVHVPGFPAKVRICETAFKVLVNK